MNYELTLTCECGRKINVKGNTEEFSDSNRVELHGENVIKCQCGETLFPVVTVSHPDRERYVQCEDDFKYEDKTDDCKVYKVFLRRMLEMTATDFIVKHDGKTDLKLQICNTIFRELVRGGIPITFQRQRKIIMETDEREDVSYPRKAFMGNRIIEQGELDG